MRKLLQKWHWIHTWGVWESGQQEYVSYPWTKPGYYAHIQTRQTRECEMCGELQERIVR